MPQTVVSPGFSERCGMEVQNWQLIKYERIKEMQTVGDLIAYLKEILK